MRLAELGWREKHLGGGMILTAHKGFRRDDVVAFVLRHPTPGGGSCEGVVPIDRSYAHGDEPWTVESWDPLTLSPSIACTKHQLHGHVRGGLWVDA